MKTIKLTKTGGGDYTALNIDRNNTLKKGITNGMIEMNKAFKIIWNTARGGYVVASEMQRAHGKTSRVKTAAAFALAGALAGHSENYYQRQHQRRENDKTDIR
ncbi:ESPR domain-containing protein [Sutterella wadsworthensis]|uniref:ESPR domain-containing protein n=1 Tax=Sutterella wadsworthensis TaxID=40545 RepID=UPI002676E0EE|nr:ESPR domain-containing protein [Sutterella wadsworthensis]